MKISSRGLRREIWNFFHPPADSVHPWRWRAMTIWIVIFSAFVIFAIFKTNNQAANLSQLEHTNCSLKTFLLAARSARLDQADTEVGDERKNDLRAADAYYKLANSFIAVGKCKIPQSLLRPDGAKRSR